MKEKEYLLYFPVSSDREPTIYLLNFLGPHTNAAILSTTTTNIPFSWVRMSFAIITTKFERGKMLRHCLKCEWVRVVLFGVVTLGVMWLLQRLRLYCHTHPLDRRCEVIPIIVKTQQSGGVLINYNSAYWPSKGDKLHLRVNRTKGATSTVYKYNYSSPDPRSLDPEEKSPAQRLHRILSHPTTSCRKLVRVGGRSCLGAYDGSKVSE